MSRRLNPCRTCTPDPDPGKFSLPRGFTRHDDRICAACRRERRRGAVELTDFFHVPPGARVHWVPDTELRTPDHHAGRGGW